MTHEKSIVLAKSADFGDHEYWLEKIYYFDFQETVYSVFDMLGDYSETFNTLEEAEKAYNEQVHKTLQSA